MAYEDPSSKEKYGETRETRCYKWNGGECSFWNFECTVHPITECYDCGEEAHHCSYVSGSKPPNYLCYECTGNRVACGCIDWKFQNPGRCLKHRRKMMPKLLERKRMNPDYQLPNWVHAEMIISTEFDDVKDLPPLPYLEPFVSKFND